VTQVSSRVTLRILYRSSSRAKLNELSGPHPARQTCFRSPLGPGRSIRRLGLRLSGSRHGRYGRGHGAAAGADPHPGWRGCRPAGGGPPPPGHGRACHAQVPVWRRAACMSGVPLQTMFVLLFPARAPQPFTGFGEVPGRAEALPGADAAARMGQLREVETVLLGKDYLESRRLARWPFGRVELPPPDGGTGPDHADVFLLTHTAGVALWEAWIPGTRPAAGCRPLRQVATVGHQRKPRGAAARAHHQRRAADRRAHRDRGRLPVHDPALPGQRPGVKRRPRRPGCRPGPASLSRPVSPPVQNR
jgi:hypothetical protein